MNCGRGRSLKAELCSISLELALGHLINPLSGSRALTGVETTGHAMASGRTDEMSDRPLGGSFHSSRLPSEEIVRSVVLEL
jgi:hypothetical protein